jgi:hypothetical protein
MWGRVGRVGGVLLIGPGNRGSSCNPPRFARPLLGAPRLRSPTIHGPPLRGVRALRERGRDMPSSPGPLRFATVSVQRDHLQCAGRTHVPRTAVGELQVLGCLLHAAALARFGVCGTSGVHWFAFLELGFLTPTSRPGCIGRLRSTSRWATQV